MAGRSSCTSEYVWIISTAAAAASATCSTAVRRRHGRQTGPATAAGACRRQTGDGAWPACSRSGGASGGGIKSLKSFFHCGPGGGQQILHGGGFVHGSCHPWSGERNSSSSRGSTMGEPSALLAGQNFQPAFGSDPVACCTDGRASLPLRRASVSPPALGSPASRVSTISSSRTSAFSNGNSPLACLSGSLALSHVAPPCRQVIPRRPPARLSLHRAPAG